MADIGMTMIPASVPVEETQLQAIMQGHIDSGLYTKEQLAEMRKREANKLANQRQTKKNRRRTKETRRKTKTKSRAKKRS
jgi:hypothetical protein